MVIKVRFFTEFTDLLFYWCWACNKERSLSKAGFYPKDLGLYGGEERDLSFRILEAGYQILYASDIVIYHKVSPNGRMMRKRKTSLDIEINLLF